MNGLILCMERKKMSKMKRKSRSKWSNGGAGGFACPCCHKILPEAKKMERRQIRRTSKALDWLNAVAEAGPPFPHGLLASMEPPLAPSEPPPADAPPAPSTGPTEIDASPIDTPSDDLKLTAQVRETKTLEGENGNE